MNLKGWGARVTSSKQSLKQILQIKYTSTPEKHNKFFLFFVTFFLNDEVFYLSLLILLSGAGC